MDRRANSSPNERDGGGFQTTHWSLVLRAAGRAEPGADSALETLCTRYWYPLYAYVRRRVADANEAQDLTQEFFSRLLEKEYLAVADPQRGKFRCFLLSSLKHFLANEWRHARARKRGGGRSFVSVDFAQGENRYCSEPADCLTPERLYDRQWALALLDQTLGRLRAEYAARGKSPVFDQLKDSLTGQGRPYAELAASLGISEAAVKMASHRLRRRYGELLKEAVTHTVAGPKDIDGELQELLAALRN